MIAISKENFLVEDVMAREQNRQEQYDRAPSVNVLAHSLIRKSLTDVRRDNQTKGRKHRINSIDSLRRNERDNDQTAQAPADEPKCGRRNFSECRAHRAAIYPNAQRGKHD